MADIEKLDAKRVRLTNKIAKSIAKHEPASGAINGAFEELFDVSEMQLFESVPPTTEGAIAKILHARLAIMFLLSNSNMDASEKTVEILKEYKEMNEGLAKMLSTLSEYFSSENGILEKNDAIEIQKAELILKHVLS